LPLKYQIERNAERENKKKNQRQAQAKGMKKHSYSYCKRRKIDPQQTHKK
jgi:hypothetical protein